MQAQKEALSDKKWQQEQPQQESVLSTSHTSILLNSFTTKQVFFRIIKRIQKALPASPRNKIKVIGRFVKRYQLLTNEAGEIWCFKVFPKVL